MCAAFRESYHADGGLEQAVIDLVRVGTAGSASGVRQLAARLVRSVPPSVSDPEVFRAALQEAMSAGSKQQPGLRYARPALPVEDGTENHLVSVDTSPSGDGLVLRGEAAREFAEVISERRQATLLAKSGVPLTRTMLLAGPPGVGKTMAAHWLAAQLDLPLVSIDLSAVVSSYLGTTGRNIREVLDYALSFPCVLLLDEFDALAKRRDDESDVGELKRIVNVVLVLLDRWPDTNLLIAATNHPQLLDSAVSRRFDRIVTMGVPGSAERRSIIEHLAASVEFDDKGIQSVLDIVALGTDGMTGSDLARLWNAARRRSVLHDENAMETLLFEVVRLPHHSGPARDRLWQAVADRLRMSNRQIAENAGVSHPTVGAALKRARRRE